MAFCFVSHCSFVSHCTVPFNAISIEVIGCQARWRPCSARPANPKPCFCSACVQPAVSEAEPGDRVLLPVLDTGVLVLQRHLSVPLPQQAALAPGETTTAGHPRSSGTCSRSTFQHLAFFMSTLRSPRIAEQSTRTTLGVILCQALLTDHMLLGDSAYTCYVHGMPTVFRLLYMTMAHGAVRLHCPLI